MSTFRAACTVGLLLAVGGCAGGSAQESQPQRSAPLSARSAGAVPTIENPLDTSAFHREPCRVLTAEDLLALGMATGTGEPEPEAALGPGCRWSDRFTGPSDSSIDVTFADGGGLAETYARRDTFSYFRELPPVHGRPTVAAGTTTGGGPPETEGTCAVAVGVSQDRSVLVEVVAGAASPHRADPCGRAVAAADLVMRAVEASM